jgi:DNA polymerase kappa
MASDSTSLHHSLLGPSLLKAGQDKVDQQKVGEVIYNASKGSKFFKNEKRRDEEVSTYRLGYIQVATIGKLMFLSAH